MSNNDKFDVCSGFQLLCFFQSTELVGRIHVDDPQSLLPIDFPFIVLSGCST